MHDTFHKTHRHALFFLALFFLCTYLLPLGVRPLIRPDEFRYAEIPREMLASGNWTVPMMDGVRYFEKPVLGYQLTAASFYLFGENAFALRLPSALAVLLTAAFLYFLVKKNNRDPLLPGLATGIYLVSGLVFGVGTFAVLDSQLTCALSLCIVSFYCAWRSPGRAMTCFWLLLAGVFAGSAFLIKGFLAIAVPVIVAVPFLVWQKDWKKLLLYPWLPLVAMAAVTLPWSLAIHQAEPDFWRYFFFEEHINRFFSHTYDRKPQPFWYFIPILSGGFMPVGLLWFAGWRGVSRAWLKTPFIRFLLCWAVVPFLFFSMSSCKLGTYILPCFPPLAVLTAIAFRRAMWKNAVSTEKVMNILRKCWGWLWIVAGGAGIIGLIVLPFIPKVPALYPHYTVFPWFLVFIAAAYGLMLIFDKSATPFRWMQIVIASFILVIFIGLRSISLWYALPCLLMVLAAEAGNRFLRNHAEKRLRTPLLLMAGLIPVLYFGIHAIPSGIFGDKMTEIGLTECFKKIPVSSDDVILTERSEVTAVAWVLKRSDLIVIGRPGELEYGFKNYPEYAAKHYPDDALPELIERSEPHRLVYIITRNLQKKPLPPEWLKHEHAASNGVVVIRF